MKSETGACYGPEIPVKQLYVRIVTSVVVRNNCNHLSSPLGIACLPPVHIPDGLYSVRPSRASVIYFIHFRTSAGLRRTFRAENSVELLKNIPSPARGRDTCYPAVTIRSSYPDPQEQAGLSPPGYVYQRWSQNTILVPSVYRSHSIPQPAKQFRRAPFRTGGEVRLSEGQSILIDLGFRVSVMTYGTSLEIP